MKLSFGEYSPSNLKYWYAVPQKMIDEYNRAKDKLDVYTGFSKKCDLKKEERLLQAKFSAQQKIEDWCLSGEGQNYFQRKLGRKK